MTISEVSKQFDLTQDTLRYYEKIGLIGPVNKGKNGIRNYKDDDLKRIEFVKCMRGAGLEISVLKRYLDMFSEGDKTIKSRKELLVEQKQKLKEKIDDMQKAYDKLVYKIELYDKQILERNI